MAFTVWSQMPSNDAISVETLTVRFGEEAPMRLPLETQNSTIISIHPSETGSENNPVWGSVASGHPWYETLNHITNILCGSGVRMASLGKPNRFRLETRWFGLIPRIAHKRCPALIQGTSTPQQWTKRDYTRLSLECATKAVDPHLELFCFDACGVVEVFIGNCLGCDTHFDLSWNDRKVRARQLKKTVKCLTIKPLNPILPWNLFSWSKSRAHNFKSGKLFSTDDDVLCGFLRHKEGVKFKNLGKNSGLGSIHPSRYSRQGLCFIDLAPQSRFLERFVSTEWCVVWLAPVGEAYSISNQTLSTADPAVSNAD